MFKLVALDAFRMMPEERVLFKTRYNFLINLAIKFFVPRNTKRRIPTILYRPDGSKEWLVPWTTKDERDGIEFISYKEGRNDVLEIIPDVISGSEARTEPLEIPEVEIKKDLDEKFDALIFMPDEKDKELMAKEMKNAMQNARKNMQEVKRKSNQKISKGGIILP